MIDEVVTVPKNFVDIIAQESALGRRSSLRESAWFIYNHIESFLVDRGARPDDLLVRGGFRSSNSFDRIRTIGYDGNDPKFDGTHAAPSREIYTLHMQTDPGNSPLFWAATMFDRGQRAGLVFYNASHLCISHKAHEARDFTYYFTNPDKKKDAVVALLELKLSD
ncbi:MAG TPA: hypothetical protein VK158_05540 [Acidobacteriota bacterium]|nr:hypothetical protein [Acidobacteriota bacterium]